MIKTGNLRTKKCKCGYEFSTKDIKPPFAPVPDKFYGGNVKKFSYTDCKCGKKYKLYIRPYNHTWEVVDMELIDAQHICQHCGKECASALGLASHEKACSKK